MRTIFAAALSAALLANMATASTAAEGVTLNAPLSGATMHSNDVALSVYYIRTSADAFEVVVTYVGDAEANQPRRIVMALSDGDHVSFGLPAHPGTLYGFARSGNAVTISDEAVGPNMDAPSEI